MVTTRQNNVLLNWGRTHFIALKCEIVKILNETHATGFTYWQIFFMKKGTGLFVKNVMANRQIWSKSKHSDSGLLNARHKSHLRKNADNVDLFIGPFYLQTITPTLCVRATEVDVLNNPESTPVKPNSKVYANQVHRALSLIQFWPKEWMCVSRQFSSLLSIFRP